MNELLQIGYTPQIDIWNLKNGDLLEIWPINMVSGEYP